MPSASNWNFSRWAALSVVAIYLDPTMPVTTMETLHCTLSRCGKDDRMPPQDAPPPEAARRRPAVSTPARAGALAAAGAHAVGVGDSVPHDPATGRPWPAYVSTVRES